MKIFITKQRIISLSGILLLILIWKILSWIAGSGDIVPSPESTFFSLIHLFSQKGFLPSVSLTLFRGIEGFLISLILSFLVGIPAGINRAFFSFINPLLVTIRSTPVISLILLAIIWFGNEQVPVFIAVLTMFPVICLNIIEGIRSVNHELVEMSRIYKVRGFRVYTDVYLPSIGPFLTSGISNAMGFGWRAIIIGEVLSQPEFGIGTMMQKAQIFLLVDELIAWTVIAIIISYMFESLIRKLDKRLIRWR